MLNLFNAYPIITRDFYHINMSIRGVYYMAYNIMEIAKYSLVLYLSSKLTSSVCLVMLIVYLASQAFCLSVYDFIHNSTIMHSSTMLNLIYNYRQHWCMNLATRVN